MQIKSDDLVLECLLNCNRKLATHLGGDVITIKSPIKFGFDNKLEVKLNGYVIEKVINILSWSLY